MCQFTKEFFGALGDWANDLIDGFVVYVVNIGLAALLVMLVATALGSTPAIDYHKAMQACAGDQQCINYWAARAERNGHPVEPTNSK